MGWLARFAAAAFGALFATAASGAILAGPAGFTCSWHFRRAAARISWLTSVAQLLSVRLGQSMVVENRPSCNGNVAGDLVARAAANGYTISAVGGLAARRSTRTSMPPCRSILSRICCRSRPLHRTTAAGRRSRARAQKLSRHDRLRPPRQAVRIAVRVDRQRQRASSGDELLKSRPAFNVTHVPYRGGGPAAIGVMTARWRPCSAAAR